MLPTEKNKDVLEQIKKLVERIDIFAETKQKLFDYLCKIQQLFANDSKAIKMQVEKFEDVITKKSFYSIGKCHSMKKFINIYKHMLTFIDGVTQLNEVELQKIDIKNSRRQQALKNKANQFTKVIDQYCKNEIGYNKNFGQYQKLCSQLDQMVSKFKSFQNPINFYNINKTTDFSKNLDKKYYQCQNKQTSLISALQLLDEKRKLLTQNLKDIKQDYVVLLNCHMDNISKAAVCLTDLSKDDMRQMSSTIQIEKTKSDVFSQQIQRFDHKYGKGNAQEDQAMFNDLKDFFNSNNCHVSITSDQRLFLDRCETFSNKKYESVDQFIYLQKKFVQQIQTQIANCIKIDKQFNLIQKNVFKSNGAKDFKKKMRKYFGQGILNITQLCFIVVDVPRRRFQKIGKMFQSHQQTLKKMVQKKQQQLKKFKKRVTLILSQYNNIAEVGVQNNIVSISQFKSNVQRTFTIFRNIFQQFSRNEGQIDRDFQQVIKKITSFTQRQFQHCLLKYTLNKDKQKFLQNMFKKFSSDSQIVQIVKQDTRYEVLFNQPLKPCLVGDFKPQIEKKKFQQTKRILHKKQYQSKGMIREKSIGCCGRSANKITKYTTITDHDVSIMCQTNIYRPGKLQIFNKGLTFEQKTKNPFCQKIKIIIPTKQILSYSSRISKQGILGIQIITNMGIIFFISQQNNQINQIQVSLQKNLGKKLSSKNQNDSKRDKSNDSSSFMKQNNTSTQYKISFQKSLLINDSRSFNGSRVDKRSTNSNLQINPLIKIIQMLKKTMVLSELFTLQKTYQAKDATRSDYSFQGDLNKFILKQRRISKICQPIQNFLYLTYEWKVSFPSMPMLKSFTHGQQIRIQLTKTTVKIIISQKSRGDNHLFVRKTFYNQIIKMNKKLSDLITQICQRQGDVIIQQQQQQLQLSTIILDTNNFTIDKQQNKYQKCIKKSSTQNFGLQCDKSNIKSTDF